MPIGSCFVSLSLFIQIRDDRDGAFNRSQLNHGGGGRKVFKAHRASLVIRNYKIRD